MVAPYKLVLQACTVPCSLLPLAAALSSRPPPRCQLRGYGGVALLLLNSVGWCCRLVQCLAACSSLLLYPADACCSVVRPPAACVTCGFLPHVAGCFAGGPSPVARGVHALCAGSRSAFAPRCSVGRVHRALCAAGMAGSCG